MSKWWVGSFLLVFACLLGAYGARNPAALGVVAELFGAFLGASVAVWGAMWVSEHRENVAREDLRRILAIGVDKVLDAAKSVVERRIGPDAAIDDLSLRDDLRDIILPWHHVAGFRPYREIRDFHTISALADLDAACAYLVALESEEQPDRPYSKDFMERIALSIGARRIARSHDSVLTGAERVVRTASDALRLLE